MDWKNYILDAPYNTLNLPNGESLNFSNPQEQSKSIKMENNIKTDSKTNFYDATNKMVNDYLKNNQTMYDNIGKYYDSYLFNRKFDEYIKKVDTERELKNKIELTDLNTIANIEILPYQLPINKLLIQLKNIWLNFFINLTNFNNPFTNFKISDLFYYGITLIIIFLLIIILRLFFE
jgi:hypothetical protein